MGDMSAVIVPKSDQINADDLIAGPMTITIASAKVSPGTEQPVSLGIVGQRKVYRPCKGMCRVMVQAWGADSQGFIGKSLMLYRDPDVTWGGAKVGGIRISHMSHINGEQVFAVSESKAKRRLMRVRPLRDGAAHQPALPPQQDKTPADDAEEAAGHGAPQDESLVFGEASKPNEGQDEPAMFEPSPWEAAARRCEARLKAVKTADELSALRGDAGFRADWRAVRAADVTMIEALERTVARLKDSLSETT